MPLLQHDRVQAGSELGLWRITESEEWFLDQLLLYPAELRQLAAIRGRRRVEWLAVRQLVHTMSGRLERGAFVKDQYGKPHLEQSAWSISISHSHELAAAIASPQLCGIDVQYIVPKITRLAPKFLNPAEAKTIEPTTELDHLHVYWGAKEALYKAHGRRQLDFREHILVEPFRYSGQQGQLRAQVAKEGENLDFDLWYQRSSEGYMLVWAILSPTPPLPQ